MPPSGPSGCDWRWLAACVARRRSCQPCGGLACDRAWNGQGGFLGKPVVPIFDALARQLGHLHRSERRQEVRFRRPAGVIDGLAAAPLQGFQIVGNRLANREWSGPGFVAFIPPQFDPLPLARRVLRLAEVEHRNPIRVLQIVRGGNLVLDISPRRSPPARKPRTAACAASVAQRHPLF